MCNSKTHRKQNRQSVTPSVLTFDQLELVAGGRNVDSLGQHLIGGSVGPILPTALIGPVGPVLPIGPGPLVPIGPVMGAVNN